MDWIKFDSPDPEIWEDYRILGDPNEDPMWTAHNRENEDRAFQGGIKIGEGHYTLFTCADTVSNWGIVRKSLEKIAGVIETTRCLLEEE